MSYSLYNNQNFQALFFKEMQINKKFQYTWQEYVGYKAWLRKLYR